jgi:uncharacterized RDD family membrane protein YckC
MDMDGERFTIRGATGVDLDLPIAGPGSRSYAFLIDWHIRVILALAWVVIAMLIIKGGLTWRSSSGRSGVASAFFVALPALTIYFLYHPIVEIFMRGQTPGKRKAGVRIVNRDGGMPSIGAILVRNVFRLIDSLPAFYVVGLVTTFVSAQRLRIGDMAAGTLLVVDEQSIPSAFLGIRAATDHAKVDLITMDLAAQILERWPRLAVDKRRPIARSLLTRSLGAADARRIDGLTDDGLRAALGLEALYAQLHAARPAAAGPRLRGRSPRESHRRA